MIRLYKQGQPEPLGTLTSTQLQFLIDELEEESTTDRDYAITPMTLGLFVEDGIDPELMEMLKAALGDQDEMTIRWETD
jgi:hypothetical protein